MLTRLIKFVVADGISLLILNMMQHNAMNYTKKYSKYLTVILINICAYDNYILIFNTTKHNGMPKIK